MTSGGLIMTTLADTSHLMTEPVSPYVSTSTADEGILALNAAEAKVNVESWKNVIEDRLVEWGRQRTVCDEEGFISPSSIAVDTAIEIARTLQGNHSPPTRVVPNGEGGIVFEKEINSSFTAIEIFETGSFEVRSFLDCRLICTKYFERKSSAAS